MSRYRRRIVSTTSIVKQILADRVVKVANPTIGSPSSDYQNNPWVSYADLEDVFSAPPLDADGKPVQEVIQKEWREDPRSLKGWTEMTKPVEETLDTGLDLKL